MKIFEKAKNTLDAVRYYAESASKRTKYLLPSEKTALVREKAGGDQLGAVIAQMRAEFLSIFPEDERDKKNR